MTHNWGISMMEITITGAVTHLTRKEPSKRELEETYRSLRTVPENAEFITERYALASVVGEIIDYLDFVGAEIEKSIGVTQFEEQQRLYRHLERPKHQEPRQQVDTIIRQWKNFDKYTHEKVEAIVSESPAASR